MALSALTEASLVSGVLAASAAATCAWAGLSASSQLFGPVLVAPPRPREILLTFDDGPNPAATPQLLDVLARHDVRATFFLIGAHARRAPDLVRAIAAAGHAVGNHTDTHPWLHLQPEARIRQELLGCNQALEDILGAPATLFRPPHGARRPAVLRLARSLGLTTVNWNIIVQDWKPAPASAVLARLDTAVAGNRRRGRASNIVLHDGGDAEPRAPRLSTVEAVNRLLTRLALLEEPPLYVLPKAWLAVP